MIFYTPIAAYYLHLAYHYTHELAYEDDLTTAFTRVVERLSRSSLQVANAIDEASIGLSIYVKQIVEFDMHDQFNMKSFQEAIRGFAEPSAIAGRERVEGDYDPIDIGFLRDEEDPMVAWVARVTTERGEYELDEEADDPEDPPRPNTFLARAVAEATTEEEGDHGDADPEAKVDLLGDIELERVERTIGGGHGHDDDDFERLMEGLPRTRSLRETPSQSRRIGSSTHVAAPSQSKRLPTSSQLVKGK
ncbi:hypothetical protein Taro_009347 [Colocasia esculenta]|uniref:Uncharacterized protein n=1 Tax=Colocasia esculenta TaxID=4460 RepID=A0A843U9P6_COLES|nr:hypothetical protein [Colocasia esculenta]